MHLFVPPSAVGFPNKADSDLADYGGAPFREELSRAWSQLEPLYVHLHAYTRRKLRQVGVWTGERDRYPTHSLSP